MRAVKAKRFRKLARAHSKGMPERELLAKKHYHTIVIGKDVKKVEQLQAINNPKSTRGIYLALKHGDLAV